MSDHAQYAISRCPDMIIIIINYNIFYIYFHCYRVSLVLLPVSTSTKSVYMFFEIFVSSILLLCTCYSNSPSRAFCYRSKLPVLATKILCPSLCFRIFGFDLPGIRGSVYNLFSTSLTTCLY